MQVDQAWHQRRTGQVDRRASAAHRHLVARTDRDDGAIAHQHGPAGVGGIAIGAVQTRSGRSRIVPLRLAGGAAMAATVAKASSRRTKPRTQDFIVVHPAGRMGHERYSSSR